MDSYTAAVLAAGSQGRVHARGYAAAGVQLIAVADVVGDAAAVLADELDIPGVYEGYGEMLDTERPDIVSICTPAAQHLDAGAIGELVSIDGYCPNLFDWGTHIVDLAFFYRDDRPPQWVTGQVDVGVRRFVYNVFAETSSITAFAWPDGVTALIATGREPQTPVLNLENDLGLILQGREGRIDVRGSRCTVRRFGREDIVFDSPFDTDPAHWERGVDPAIVASTAAAIADLVACLRDGSEPVCAAAHGIAGAEIIFATYESSRSRRRVALPLAELDNALLSGLEAGFWQPVGDQRSTY